VIRGPQSTALDATGDDPTASAYVLADSLPPSARGDSARRVIGNGHPHSL